MTSNKIMVFPNGEYTFKMTGVFSPRPDDEFLNLVCQEDPSYKQLLQLWLDKKIIGKKYTMMITVTYNEDGSPKPVSFRYKIYD